MRVYINGRFLTQPVSGVQRTAREVVRELDRRVGAGAARLPYTLVVPRDAHGLETQLVSHMPVLHARLSGHAFEQVELPWLSRRGLLLGLGNTGPVGKAWQVVFMYDANVWVLPEAFNPWFRRWYKVMLPLMGRLARRVLVDSEFARQELARYARIPLDRMVVAHLGADHIERVEADERILDRTGLRGTPFLLAVSNQSPNKNFAGVVAAMRLLPAALPVAIAGGSNERIFGDATHTFPDSVHLLGYVTDEELRALYSHAGCFVYPSLYEGFGIPPVEAMRCGCPVVVSNRSSLPEVCGDAAEYCDPLQPEDIARAIQLVTGSAEARERLRARGNARAARFTWAHTADVVEGALQEVAASA